jgi:AraC-like DNA-binding protein
MDKCHHDYSFLSKLFSEVNGISIERYYIIQKIERIKELLVYDELSISEIADKLNYSSAAHLSTQFRNMTGISPSQFKRLKEHKLKPLDEV